MDLLFRCSLVWIFFAYASMAFSQAPRPCVVHDPELQGSYAGACKEGLAEGNGEATGIAHYKGAFKAGRKEGRGVKTWLTGDRYDGEFVNDRKQGAGTYTWGRSSIWAAEKYVGTYRNDRRHGWGIYEWPDGDRYVGRWNNDVIAGQPTSKMYARSRAYTELASAVALPGNKICKNMMVGIATQDWVRGTVMEVAEGKIAVRIDDPGLFRHLISNLPINRGDVVWDALQFWTPCL